MELESRNCEESTENRNRGSDNQHLNLDLVLRKIGGFGGYHKKQIFLLWLMNLSAGPGLLSFAFTGLFLKQPFSFIKFATTSCKK